MGRIKGNLATIALVIGLGVGDFIIYDNFIVVPPTIHDIPPENH